MASPAWLRSVIALRREIHAFPCLSGQEQDTVGRVAAFISGLGLQPQTVLEGRGLVVDLPAATAAPYVALRADLDALPITEATGLSFSSTHPGVHHACGHDGHAAMVAGAAAILMSEIAEGNALPAPVRLIFQPEEETGRGAKAMMEAGALQQVAMVFGGHLDRGYSTGTLVVASGCVNASTDDLIIEIQGKGGHGARPHETVDAVIVAAETILALQTVVSRTVNPADPAVVTVGRVQAGTAPNIVAGTARLEGTVRALSSQVRDQLHAAIKRIVSGIAQAHGASASATFANGTPPVVNAPAPVALARQAAAAVVSAPEHVRENLHSTNMGGEDFGFYSESLPAAYIRIGTNKPHQAPVSAHSAQWDLDEDSLEIGANYFAKVARLAAEKFSLKAPTG